MKVKDVILLAAEEIGIGEKVKGYLSTASTEGERETKELLRCFHLVENEVALDYLPLLAEDTILTTTGDICFSELSCVPVRVFSVREERGERAAYDLFPDKIKTGKSAVYTVTYSYMPKKKELDDEAEYKQAVSERLLSFGVAAEYCTANGLYEEAKVWNEKYKDAIKAAYRQKRCRVMRTRRWA